MKHFFFVNETNVLRLAILALIGREVFVVDYRPYLRLSQAPLRRVVGALFERGKVQELHAVDPEAMWCEHMPLEIALNDGFGCVEKQAGPIIDISRRFENTGYAYPSLKATDKFIQVLVDDALRIRWLEEKLPNLRWKIHGTKQLIPAIYGIKFSEAPKARLSMTSRLAEVGANLINFVTLLAFSATWLAMRTRLVSAPVESYVLCADVYAPWMKDFFPSLVDRSEDLLVYYRNQENLLREGHNYTRYRSCMRDDARLGLSGFVETVGLVLKDSSAILTKMVGHDPDAVVKMLTLASHRAMYRAFFKRFQPKFFWSQEDYSETHTVLSLEARHIGAKTLGGMHGVPHMAVDSFYRHVDFDANYIIGSHFYQRYQRETWPSHMKVVAIGSLHTRGRHKASIAAARPKDIAVFVNPSVEIGRFLDAVYEIARRFPDRKLILKGKPGKEGMMTNASALYANAPANCVVIDPKEDPYEMLLKCSYCLTIATSLAAEAIQFRCATYMFDLYQHLDFFYYHDFPGLCQPSAAAIIEKIERIESGAESYPWATFNGMAEQNGPDFVNSVREFLGLRPLPLNAKVA
jgi:hypothetical protein